jgi:hypothetical protein
VHTPCEDKSSDVKGSFYEKLGRVFDQFRRYDVKILSGDINAKVGRKDIFKPTISNESSHEISNGNGVRVVSFATSGAWDTVRENVKILAKDSIGLREWKHRKPWLDEDCLKLVDMRLQDPSEVNEENLSNVRQDASRHFMNKEW